MQIARIIASSGDDVSGLADLLRSRGFEVEVTAEDGQNSQDGEWIGELQQLSSVTKVGSQGSTGQMPTETSDWPIWKLLEGTELQTEPSAPVEGSAMKPRWESVVHATCEAGDRVVRQGRRVVFALTPDERLFRKLATITAVAAVFVLLLSAARPHRLSPLPATVLQTSKEASQAVPFQVKTVTAAGTVSQALESAPANELRLSGQEKPAAAVDSEIIAKDTVIRYKRRRRVPRVAPNTQPSRKTLAD